MPVKYVIHRSKVNKDQVKYIARVRSLGTADLDDVIAQMIKQAGPTAVRSQVVSTIEDFVGAVAYLLSQGYNVNTPLANFRLSVRGDFTGPDDTFDPARHTITVQASAGRYLCKTVPPLVELARQPNLPLSPVPGVYTDAGSGARNNLLTPHNAGKVTGHYLRFDPADPAQGVFFRRSAGGEETRVTYYSEILPSRVHFLVPDLPAGSYWLGVRTRPEDDGDLYRGALDANLTVV